MALRVLAILWLLTFCQGAGAAEAILRVERAQVVEVAGSDAPPDDADWLPPKVALARDPPGIGHNGRLPDLERPLLRTIRAGVPMYLVYPADPGKAPVLLPELLTLDATLEALREAGRGKGVRMTATGPMLRKPQMEEDAS